VKFGRPPTSEATMPLSSLLDVVLLLLIFFVVTSSFAERRIPLELPDAESATTAEDEALVLEIEASGRLLLEGDEVRVEELDARLTTLGTGEGALEIRADRTVQHGLLVDVIDRARLAGIERLGIGVAAASVGRAGATPAEASTR